MRNPNMPKILISDYQKHEAFSPYIADCFGILTAAAFAAGSDMLLDYIQHDLEELKTMPASSHIGQSEYSFIKYDLPAQFMTRYDYEFFYQLKCTLINLRKRAKSGEKIILNTVLEEIVLYMCGEKADYFIESNHICFDFNGVEDTEYYKDWIYDLMSDDDVCTFLYSDIAVDEDHTYHFSHWNEKQFFMDGETNED